MYYKIHNKIQLAKNQCHTANISIERHVEAASCCYDGHQNGRGLYGCLPSNAGRSCNSLRRLRQARICRRISCGCVGVLITLQRYEKSERNANKNAFIFISERTSSSTNVLRLRLSTYGAQEGTTFLRHIQENTRQFIILSGLIWTQVDRSGQWLRQLSYLCTVFKTHREYWRRLGIENGPFLCTRLAQYLHSQSGTTSRRGKIYSSAEEDFPISGAVKDPRPPLGGEIKKTNLNQTQAWKRSGMIALTAGQRKNDTY